MKSKCLYRADAVLLHNWLMIFNEKLCFGGIAPLNFYIFHRDVILSALLVLYSKECSFSYPQTCNLYRASKFEKQILRHTALIIICSDSRKFTLCIVPYVILGT